MKKRATVVVGLLIAVGLGIAALLLPKETTEINPVPIEKGASYVAMGDSVASGLGLATPIGNPGCGRTKESYPHLLASDRGYRLVHLACTGATLEAGINNPQTAAGEQSSQLEQLFQQKPKLITFAIGANDVTWFSRLSQCLSGECGSDAEKRDYQSFLEGTFRPQLKSSLTEIKKRYGNEARLLVIEYYQVFPEPGANCNDITGLDSEGLEWARELRGRLNRAVYDTVRESGIGTYISIDFSDHELCTKEPWIQGANDPAPYHANAAGQRAIAEQIKQAIN